MDNSNEKNVKTTREQNKPSSNKNISETNKKSSLLPKVLSVLAALTLWLYVFQAVELEKEFDNVPVIIENFNKELGYDIVSGYTTNISVTISGTQRIINGIDKNDIKASVNMSDVVSRGTHKLDVDIHIPDGAKLLEVSDSEIYVTLDKTTEKELPLGHDLVYNIQYPYQLGEVSLSSKGVKLTGPETDLNSVVTAKVNLELGNVTNNVSAVTNVKLYDENGYEIESRYIKVIPSRVQADIPVYKTAKVSVLPNIAVNKDTHKYEYSPESVYIYGRVSDVESVAKLSTVANFFTDAGEYEIDLVLPSGVKAYQKSQISDENLITKVKVKVSPVENK